MRTWAEELQAHTHDYVRRGGKQNRKKQVSLIIDFLEYTDSTEKLTSLHRLGKRHVINFWKSHRNLSDKVAYDYWLGICKLWVWLDKPDKPPKPNNFVGQDIISNGVFTEASAAIKAARESHKYTVQKLANMAGLEALLIESIEKGNTNIILSDILYLLEILKIKFTI
jgi:DNA-binding XRE family transcriptional regulator